MKKCFKCFELKALIEFYKHSRMADGHLNKCIRCAIADVLKHRLMNIKKVRAYDSLRAKLPHRRKQNAAQTKKARQRNPFFMKAHNAVQRKLEKQPCERCGTTKFIHGHHDDYSKPIDVMWLCAAHHKERHKELNLFK